MLIGSIDCGTQTSAVAVLESRGPEENLVIRDVQGFSTRRIRGLPPVPRLGRLASQELSRRRARYHSWRWTEVLAQYSCNIWVVERPYIKRLASGVSHVSGALSHARCVGLVHHAACMVGREVIEMAPRSLHSETHGGTVYGVKTANSEYIMNYFGRDFTEYEDDVRQDVVDALLIGIGWWHRYCRTGIVGDEPAKVLRAAKRDGLI